MKTKVFLRMLFMVFLSVVGLTACSDDEPKDSVKEIRMQVSASCRKIILEYGNLSVLEKLKVLPTKEGMSIISR